jgi:hypothetical protein
MSLTSVIKPVVPRGMRPFAIDVYLRGHRQYFSLYRRLFPPNPRYLAVAEQNNLTYFPPEWTSVCRENADVLVDLETEYRFDFSEVEFAYSGHTIEHLSDAAVRRLFGNLFRSMRKGAVIRIECPDIDLLLDDYKCVHNNDRKVTKQMVALMEASLKPEKNGVYDQEHVKVLMGIVNYFDPKRDKVLPPLVSAEEFKEKIATLSNTEFGDWAVSLLTSEQLRDSFMHRNWFNFHKVERLLTEAGFSGVVRCEAGETHYKFRMNINRKHRSWCSIFVEAIKK